MRAKNYSFYLHNTPIQVQRKRIKNLYLRLRSGGVQISAPLYATKKEIQHFAHAHWPWVHEQLKKQRPPLQYTQGELHFFEGRPYTLKILHNICTPGVWLVDDHSIELHTPPHSGPQERKALFDAWYTKHTYTRAQTLIQKWEPRLQVRVHRLDVKTMKSCWGTCNSYTKCIRLNSEIMKQPRPAFEYVVLHEMVHLLENNHSPAFYRWLDRFMPPWREHERLLDRSLSHHI